MFAMVMFRSLKILSGISGAATRASIARNIASSTAAARSKPSVCRDVQPASLPLTMAYTASISDVVTVTAPQISSRRSAT
jgi:hypothetical protein